MNDTAPDEDSLAGLERRQAELTASAAKLAAEMDALRERAAEPSLKTMRDIAGIVAAANGLTIKELTGPSRNRHIAWPRQRAWLLCREKGLTLTQIGRFFRRDHTTIMAGIAAAKKREGAAG